MDSKYLTKAAASPIGPTHLGTADASRPAKVMALLVFIVGCTRFIDLAIFGRVVISELLMVAAFPFILKELQVAVNTRTAKRYLVFLMLALASITISDLVVNGVGGERYIRTVARFGFTTMIGLFWGAILLRRFDLLLPFLWGSVIGAGINIFRVSEFDRESVQMGATSYDFWLSKGSPLITSAIMLACAYIYKHSKFAVAVVLIAAAVFIAVMAGRTRAAVLLVAAMSMGIVWYMTAFRRRQLRLGRTAVIKLAAAFMLAGMVVYFAYIFAAPSGLLGEYQQRKFEKQTATLLGVTPWGILLGGRVDFLQSALVVADNPFLGVGSWSIPRSYLLDAYQELGLEIPWHVMAIAMSDDSSAGHSMLMGSWATGGILTVPYFVFLLYLSIRVLLFSVNHPTRFTPLIVSSCVTLAFAILFNPFSLSGRNGLGLVLGIAIALELSIPGFVKKRRRATKTSSYRPVAEIQK